MCCVLSGHSLIRVHASVCVRILPHSSSLWIVVGRVWIQIPQVLWDRDTHTDYCSCPSFTRTLLNGFTTGMKTAYYYKSKSLTLAVSSLIRRFLTVIRLLESKFCPGMSMSSAYLSSSSSSLLCSLSCRNTWLNMHHMLSSSTPMMFKFKHWNDRGQSSYRLVQLSRSQLILKFLCFQCPFGLMCETQQALEPLYLSFAFH